MIRLPGLALCVFALAVPFAGAARAETLADIRAELSQLAASLQALKSELVSSGTGLQAAGGATALDRMNTMEAELSRLTSETEELQNRIDRVVSDGTNRVGDLEFRLCEMEEGCDIANLPITATLGGEAGTAAPALPPPGTTAPPSGGAELAVGEQADFDRAREVLDQGDFRGAADLFATFTQTYTGGPLTGEAHFRRGEALTKLGETANAARAYLEGFSGSPDGPFAADNLLRLGTSLGQLGQTQEACVTLAEVGTRFPGHLATAEAASQMRTLGCQ